MIHPKTLLISRHFYSLESYVRRSIYNLKVDTISTYYIPLDRSCLKLWNGIRHVMPSTDRRLELKEKTSMAQNAWQAFVYASGLTNCRFHRIISCTPTDKTPLIYFGLKEAPQKINPLLIGRIGQEGTSCFFNEERVATEPKLCQSVLSEFL